MDLLYFFTNHTLSCHSCGKTLWKFLSSKTISKCFSEGRKKKTSSNKWWETPLTYVFGRMKRSYSILFLPKGHWSLQGKLELVWLEEPPFCSGCLARWQYWIMNEWDGFEFKRKKKKFYSFLRIPLKIGCKTILFFNKMKVKYQFYSYF